MTSSYLRRVDYYVHFHGQVYLIEISFYGGCFLPFHYIWSISLIKSDLKWCIHLSRSLFLIRYCIMRGFHGSFATDVSCQQGALTLPGTCFRPLLGPAYSPIVENSVPELAVSFILDLSP